MTDERVSTPVMRFHSNLEAIMDTRDEMAAIREIQENLQILYKDGYSLPYVGVDGIYGDATADAVGINVTAYKYVATCVGSGIAGLGGLCYVIDYSGSQEAYLSVEPLGWLSIALVIFALWRPHLSIFGSVVFGALFVAGSFLPDILPIPFLQSMEAAPLMKMLPYVVTIIVLVVTSIRDKKENQPPASLGMPYFREER